MLRMEEERIINPDLKNELEERLENSLRPASLDEYIGQDKVKEKYEDIYRSCQKKGRTIRPLFILWTSRTWKDNNFNYNSK